MLYCCAVRFDDLDITAKISIIILAIIVKTVKNAL